MLTDEGVEIAFFLCMETQYMRPPPHVLPLHSLGVGSFFANEDESNIVIYGWNLDTVEGHSALSILMQ